MPKKLHRKISRVADVRSQACSHKLQVWDLHRIQAQIASELVPGALSLSAPISSGTLSIADESKVGHTVAIMIGYLHQTVGEFCFFAWSHDFGMPSFNTPSPTLKDVSEAGS